jgi:hypothetical protein
MINQTQLYGIGIYEMGILLTDFTGKHPTQYIVEQEELMKLFKFDRKVTLKPFPGLIWMKASLEGVNSYLVTMKRHKRKILYSDGKKLSHIPMTLPNIAIYAKEEGGYMRISSVYAYPGELKPSTPTYDLPLPNIGLGNVCMGSVKIPVGKNIMKAIDSALFDTPFNNHQGLVGKDNILFKDYVVKHRGYMPFSSLTQIGTGRKLLEAS